MRRAVRDLERLSPVAAFLEQVPRWLGIVDVIVAATLVLAAIALALRRRSAPAREQAAAFATAQKLSIVVPVLPGLFFMAPSAANWQVLVIGLAWRGWLLMQVLPFVAAAARAPACDAPGSTR